MSNRINVNMTPNPSDIQTLHCSQGDTEERKFQFVFHNQGEVFDSENISDPVFTSFPVEVGGTEEIQPVNGTTPSTSPIIADITYPDGLREGEEFTYRESPTTISGNANFKAVYGNTLVWNQLLNSTATTSTVNGITYTNNGDGSWTVSGTATATAQKALTTSADRITAISGHKYLMLGGLANGGSSKWLMQLYKNNANTLVGTDSGNGVIYTADDTTVNLSIYFTVYNGNTVSGKIYPQIFDLTAMFGAGNEPTSVAEFTALFPLPYYNYNAGSLLSFNGTGIKTVGFNQWDEEWEVGNWRSSDGQSGSLTDRIRSKNYIEVFPNKDYYFKSPVGYFSVICWYDESKTFISSTGGTSSSVNTVYTSPVNAKYMRFCMNDAYGTVYNDNICINISNTELNGTYEPYFSNTTNLPTETYFPTGMKSAGSVYDELTPTKAITRVGAVDLGSLTYTMYQVTQGNLFRADLSDAVLPYDSTNIICAKYPTLKASARTDKCVCVGSAGRIDILDSSYSVATAFKTAMSGVYLYYDLATPSETTILSASLITENGEAPLYKNGDVLECECNENISSEPGFHVAKVKFTDGDGANYSNKIQIHVERSPQ